MNDNEKRSMTLYEFLITPTAMDFFSKPENLVNFLKIQSNLHHISTPWGQPHPIGTILDETIEKLENYIEDHNLATDVG